MLGLENAGLAGPSCTLDLFLSASIIGTFTPLLPPITRPALKYLPPPVRTSSLGLKKTDLSLQIPLKLYIPPVER